MIEHHPGCSVLGQFYFDSMRNWYDYYKLIVA